MSAVDSGLESWTLLPDGLGEALHRRLRELAGTGLIGVSVLLALALATWSVQDPSLSHATNAPVRNMLGLGGGVVPGPLTPMFRLAPLPLVLPLALLGRPPLSHPARSPQRP